MAEACGIDEPLGKKGVRGVLRSVASRQAFLSERGHRIWFVYTPKHSAWFNQIEVIFGVIMRKVIRRGSFTSVADITRTPPGNEGLLMLIDDAAAASTRAGALLSPGEQRLLFQLAREVPPGGTIVELGSWMGGSTIMLAAGASDSLESKVYAVDLFGIDDANSLEYSERVGGHGPDYLARFKDNLREAGVESRVQPIRSLTVLAARRWEGPPIDFLFLDASHYYDDVASDFIEWSAHCAEGARCAFHDYGRMGIPGVQKFVDEVIERGLLKDVKFVDSIAYGTIMTTDRRAIKDRLRPRFSDLFRIEKNRESWYIFSKNHGWMALSEGERWRAFRYALQAIRWGPTLKEGWLLMACSALNRRGNAESTAGGA